MFAQEPKPKKEDVLPLCFPWDVQQKERQNNRPLATLIAELRQAVLAEGTRLRSRGLAAQPGVSANSETGEETSAAQPGSTAISAEQLASINVVPDTAATRLSSLKTASKNGAA